MFSQSAETTASEQRQLIDWEYLHQLCDDSPEFLWELLGLFTADSHVNLKTLKQAIAAEDYWKTEQAAHHIRGASANVGATTMSAAAAQIEQQARDHRFEATDRLLENMETALHQIQTLVTANP